MSEPFLAEIRIFGFDFAPRGHAKCDGQILPINQNQSLFSLLGTTYGGDGRTSFALPELRGRAPIHKGTAPGGSSHSLGQKSGQQTHSLSVAEIPAHNHNVVGQSGNANSNVATGRLFSRAPQNQYRGAQAASEVNMNAASILNAGANQGHNNMQPYQVLNFCIALQGLFPSRN